MIATLRALRTPIVVLLIVLGASQLRLVPPIVLAVVIYTVPGYLAVLLLVGAEQSDPLERWLLSIGMSFVLVALGALVLNATPTGVSPMGWVIYFVGVSAVMTVLLALRRAPIPSLRHSIPDLNPRDGWVLLVAVLVSLLAVGIAARGAQLGDGDGFTELWIERTGNTSVQLTVRNRELGRTSYRIVARQGGRTILDQTLSLDVGEQRSLSATTSGSQAVDGTLYRAGDESAYREVRLALTDSGSG